MVEECFLCTVEVVILSTILIMSSNTTGSWCKANHKSIVEQIYASMKLTYMYFKSVISARPPFIIIIFSMWRWLAHMFCDGISFLAAFSLSGASCCGLKMQ